MSGSDLWKPGDLLGPKRADPPADPPKPDALWLDRALAEQEPRMLMEHKQAALLARSLWSSIETRLCGMAIYNPECRLAVSPPRFSDTECVVRFKLLKPGERLQPEDSGWTIYGPFPDGRPRPPADVHPGNGLALWEKAGC